MGAAFLMWTWGGFLLLQAINFSAIAAPKPPSPLTNEVTAFSLCKADPKKCICPVGTHRRTFIGTAGAKFVQCMKPLHCEAGQQKREYRTGGGKWVSRCEAVVARQYVEPKFVPKKGVK